MNYTPWIIGLVLALIYFTVFEVRAFRDDTGRTATLSRAIYDLGHHWPLAIFIMGGFAFGLAVHFFWHWCPPGSLSTGFLVPLIAGNLGG